MGGPSEGSLEVESSGPLNAKYWGEDEGRRFNKVSGVAGISQQGQQPWSPPEYPGLPVLVISANNGIVPDNTGSAESGNGFPPGRYLTQMKINAVSVTGKDGESTAKQSRNAEEAANSSEKGLYPLSKDVLQKSLDNLLESGYSLVGASGRPPNTSENLMAGARLFLVGKDGPLQKRTEEPFKKTERTGKVSEAPMTERTLSEAPPTPSGPIKYQETPNLQLQSPSNSTYSLPLPLVDLEALKYGSVSKGGTAPRYSDSAAADALANLLFQNTNNSAAAFGGQQPTPADSKLAPVFSRYTDPLAGITADTLARSKAALQDLGLDRAVNRGTGKSLNPYAVLNESGKLPKMFENLPLVGGSWESKASMTDFRTVPTLLPVEGYGLQPLKAEGRMSGYLSGRDSSAILDEIMRDTNELMELNRRTESLNLLPPTPNYLLPNPKFTPDITSYFQAYQILP